MEVFKREDGLAKYLRTRGAGDVGLVMTMGQLHDGHLSLVDEIRRHGAAKIIGTIFVNPLQFNNPEDLAKYPRNLERDLALFQSRGVDAVFAPEDPSAIYPPGFQTAVEVGDMAVRWEGEHRPGHFRGVTTVVALMFNLIRPDVAIFGEKDFQQLRVIEQMVRDLRFPIAIVRGKELREPDGLAMSSRNVRLSPEARSQALVLSRSLFSARDAFQRGEKRAERLRALVAHELETAGIHEVDYIGIVREEDLAPIEEVSAADRILLAAHVGGVRLIDNIGLTG